ncbi:DUF4136 domain-containing protein [Aquabacterium sp. OR-4]|uniref:DUF4136 domain-containing protein n=1 Tax=Aquabacterium sp. OR-4 TaxID=2978127 RepID=UPI0021B42445|nr:DUF4136 domain-containing protein [Aquabacterium sp. OR-4]MDT7837416.1 DUF4136 domain-containing protein [Aquabacterium sp. OR-4]
MQRRHLISAATLAPLALLLGGCATLSQLGVEVSSFGDWPAARDAGHRGSYAFERLPSQQQAPQAALQQQLETAAAAALARLGFTPVAAGGQPDLVVQLGARVSRTDRSPWDDPLWWHGGFGPWRVNPWRGPFWAPSPRFDNPRYDHEVALLIRERGTGKPLYEARASHEGWRSDVAGVLAPLFAAALMDFPATGPNPRTVRVPLTPG